VRAPWGASAAAGIEPTRFEPLWGPASVESSAEGGQPLLSASSAEATKVEFDLTSESGEERHSNRVQFGPFIAVYAGLGVALTVLGTAWYFGFQGGSPVSVSIGCIVVGFAILVAGSIAMWRLGSTVVIRHQVGPTGIAFQRRNGKSLSVGWSDPTLKVNLFSLEGDASKVLPRGDARLIRPNWVDVFSAKHHFVRLETTIPVEASAALVEQARGHGVRLSRTRAAFFWQSAPKSPGWLDWQEDGHVTDGHPLNGELVKLRGPEARPDP